MMLGGVICNNQSNASFGATFIMAAKLRRVAINGGFALYFLSIPQGINRQIFYLMQTLRTTISGILSKLGPMGPFGKIFRCEKYFQSQPANMGVGPHPIFQLTV